jgi:hypothetical protein
MRVRRRSPPVVKQVFLHGRNNSNRVLYPGHYVERQDFSAERLVGAALRRGPNARLQYSVYVRPTLLGNVKTVILDSRLRDIEPMAFDFVMNFAKDNDLLVTEACELPPHHATQQHS